MMLNCSDRRLAAGLDVEMFSSYQTYFSQADGYSYEDMDEFELVSSTVREDDEDMMFI